MLGVHTNGTESPSHRDRIRAPMKSLSSWHGVVLMLSTLLAAAAGPAHAAASAWGGDQRAQVRLVTGSDHASGGSLQAGLEFRYPDGWHGYWRTPGDAGIAPVLDWSKSSNLQAVSVAWPAPARLVVSGLQSGIYTGDFVLPLTLKLSKSDVTTRLAISLDYATCSTVCIPEHAELSVVLPAGPPDTSAEEGEIAAARARVPGAPREAGIRVVKSELAGNGSQRHLTVQLSSDGMPFHDPDLFVEGAGAGLPPAPTVRFTNQKHNVLFTVPLPAPRAADKPAELTLTVVDGPRAAEFRGPLIRK
jgi:suppressor for copper-sensitivity B